MARTDVGSAVNARPTTIVEYGVDPRGLRLFRGLAGVLQRGIAGTDGTRVLERNAEWNGYAVAPQQFTGMAPLGNARPVVERSSELADERAAGALTDGALRIFADRLRRQR